MKRLARVFSALMALAALLCLCACSQRPEQYLAAAQEKLAAVDSLSCGIVMDMGMSLAGESFNIKSTCQADCTSEPAAVRLEVSTDMGGLGTLDYTAYAVESGGNYSAFIELPETWVRQDLSGVGALEQYDMRVVSARWQDGLTGVTDAGLTELDGQKARRYDCTLSAEAVDGIMDSSGAYETLSVLGIEDSAAREMLSGLGEIPMSVWVGSQGLPLRYELELTGVMSALMDSIAGAVGEDYAAMSIHSLTVSISLGSFDSVDAIEVPAEALDACPLEGEELF